MKCFRLWDLESRSAHPRGVTHNLLPSIAIVAAPSLTAARKRLGELGLRAGRFGIASAADRQILAERDATVVWNTADDNEWIADTSVDDFVVNRAQGLSNRGNVN